MGAIRKAWNKYSSLWDDLKGWKLFLFYTLHFTFVFVILQYIIFYQLRNAGLSFVWSTDGTDQHFIRLLYISDNAHDLWKNLIEGNGIVWPMYDFRTGFTVHDLQVGFPHILAAFWPSDKMDTFYTLLVLGNLYMAGLTFSALGFYFKQKPMPIMIAAISYAFSAYAVFANSRHPHFMVPCILLPVLIIGVERALKGERSVILAITVLLSLTAQWGLYFSCMQAVFVALYTLVRLPFVEGLNGFGERFKRMWNVVFWGVVGVLLSGAVMVPSLISMTGDGRSDPDLASKYDLLSYDATYYKLYFTNYAVNHPTHTKWMIVSFAALVLPAIILLFMDKDKKVKHLKIIWGILTVMHAIPFFAFILSGFSNPANRYCFGYTFFCCLILLFEINKITEISKVKGIVVGSILAVYVGACVIINGIANFNWWPYVILLGSAAIIAVILITLRKKPSARSGLSLLAAFLVTCISVSYTGNQVFTEKYLTQFYPDGLNTISEDYLYSAGKSSVIQNDTDFARVDGNAVPYKGSFSGFHFGIKALTGYPYFGWSHGYEDWIVEMEVARHHNKHRYLGTNARPQLLSLSTVKYFMDRKTDFSIVPYGFKPVETIERSSSVSDVVTVNENYLPIGYTYDSYMLRDDYDGMSGLDKQETQLNDVVLDRAPSINIKRNDKTESVVTQVPCKITAMIGIDKSGDVYKVTQANAMMVLEVQGLPNMNTYLRFNNMKFPAINNNYMLLTANSNYSTAVCTYTDVNYIYYTGQDTMLLDMGYSEKPVTRITVAFDHKGQFTVDSIEAWCEDLTDYPSKVAKLGEEVLTDVTYGNRSMKGKIECKDDKFLVVTLPYMNGWKAYLDGKEVDIYQANTAFMGIEVPAGSHTVEFRYWLPGLNAGLCVSGVGIVVFVGVLVYLKKKKKST